MDQTPTNYTKTLDYTSPISREPGLSRAELTVDQCLNWIRKELFEESEFLVIYLVEMCDV